MRASLLLPALLLATALGVAAMAPVGAQPRPGPLRLEIELVSRVDTEGRGAQWTATARTARDSEASFPAPATGRCRPAVDDVAPSDALPVDRVRLLGAVAGDLPAGGVPGAWQSMGPRRVGDPAWGVGAVELQRGVERVRVADALRLPGAPQVAGVTTAPDGAVTVRWRGDEDEHEVRIPTTGGVLRCAPIGASVTIPAADLDAGDGSYFLRTTRVRTSYLPSGLEVRVRASIERELRRDEPAPQAAPPLPPPPASAPDRGPRHSTRPPRPVYG